MHVLGGNSEGEEESESMSTQGGVLRTPRGVALEQDRGYLGQGSDRS